MLQRQTIVYKKGERIRKTPISLPPKERKSSIKYEMTRKGNITYN